MRRAKLSASRQAFGFGWDAACRVLEAFEPIPSIANPVPQLRIALVKQSTYTDLYTNPHASNPTDLLFSSGHRSGPIGLFVHFDSRFFIVHVEDDPECQIWREKRQFETHPEWHARHAAMSAVAVRADDVDWSEFDLVIAIDTAVPSRIAKRYPSVLWATMLEHHRLPDYHRYRLAPPDGYAVLLSQHFGPTPRSFFRRPHVIEWPYGFVRSDTLRLLFPDSRKQRTVHYEANQAVPVSTYKPYFESQGIAVVAGGYRSLKNHLQELLSATVFFAPRSARRLWGNSFAEAVAAECICVGNRRDYWNPCLVPNELNFRDSKRACELVSRIIDNAELSGRLLAEQQRRLDWFCFWRPLKQLLGYARTYSGRLTINARSACV